MEQLFADLSAYESLFGLRVRFGLAGGRVWAAFTPCEWINEGVTVPSRRVTGPDSPDNRRGRTLTPRL
jgi:hypothetical protein